MANLDQETVLTSSDIRRYLGICEQVTSTKRGFDELDILYTSQLGDAAALKPIQDKIRPGGLLYSRIRVPRTFPSDEAKIFVTSHELTHLLLNTLLDMIPRPELRYPLEEGLCDAVAMAVLRRQFGESTYDRIVSDRAQRYRCYVDERPQLTDIYIHEDNPSVSSNIIGYSTDSTRESIGHVLGRNFVYQLLATGIAPSDVIPTILSQPPKLYQLQFTSGYLDLAARVVETKQDFTVCNSPELPIYFEGAIPNRRVI